VSEGQNEGQEKSFEPTPRKLEQAREKGDVAKSQDVSAAAAYLGVLLALGAAGAGMASRFGEAVTPFLGAADRLEGRLLGPGGLAASGAMLGEASLAVLPLFVIPAALVLAALIAQRAIVVAPEKINFKLNRISPLAQAKQKFGPTGLVEFAKSMVKMTLISAVVWFWLVAETPKLVGLVRADSRVMGAMLAETTLSLFGAVAAIAVAIAAVDVLWQRYDHARKLRMSLEELRKESKETEGDPHLKSERRRRAEGVAMNRMLNDVPEASVVVVNPEHYAVALRWSREAGGAPVCVAKGVDDLAAAIRARAAEAGVPIHRDPPTARSLHALVEIGEEIREEHYHAVAAALRFAEDIRRRARALGRG
jgi:flagellar biosynthetic protein FlhB